MGTLDYLKEYQPINYVPQAALNSPLLEETFRPRQTYAEPTYVGAYTKQGPFTVAGVWELNHDEFLDIRVEPFINNTQIVTVPERPVDKGTWQAIVGNNKLFYVQPNSGVYNQPMTQWNSQVVAGGAPHSGVYTGLGDEGS